VAVLKMEGVSTDSKYPPEDFLTALGGRCVATFKATPQFSGVLMVLICADGALMVLNTEGRLGSAIGRSASQGGGPG